MRAFTTMSMRQTEEIAEEASRFSIRSFFPMSMTMRSPIAEVPYAQPQMQPQPQPQPQIQAAPPQLSLPLQQPQPQLPVRSQLRFNLPIQQQTAAAPVQQEPFKFALPAAVHEPMHQAAVAATATANSVGVTAQGASRPVDAHVSGSIPGMASVRTMPVEAHEAEIARIAVVNNELTERLKLSESKLVRTEASVVRGNQALATERVQYKQKIVSLSEEMDTLRANEKRAVEELGMRADDSAELSKLKLDMKTLEKQHKSATEATAAEYASLSGDYMELSEAKDALQREAATYIKSIGDKEAVISAMAIELDTVRRTAASAEVQIDELDAKLAHLRVEQIFESPDATTGHCGSTPAQKEEGEGEEEEEKEKEKQQQPRTFKPSPEAVKETLENEFGKPEGEAETTTTTSAAVESSWTIAEREAQAEAEAVAATPATKLAPMIVRLSTCCCDGDGASKQVVAEGEAKAARVHLAKHLHDRCCTMGVHFADDPLAPDLHAYVETGAPSDALRAAQIANPAASTDAAVRTATYVAAVSEDIKKRMTGQREQWAKAVQIGAAA